MVSCANLLACSYASPSVYCVPVHLQVNGCLSYTDRISDGFYNILGMNPYLWVMCNDVEEGTSLPSLMALKAVDPIDTSMEVVLVDRRGDSMLRKLEDKAQVVYFAAESPLMLVGELGKLVAVHMGEVLNCSFRQRCTCLCFFVKPLSLLN